MLLFKRADEVEVGDWIDLQSKHLLCEVVSAEFIGDGWSLLNAGGFELHHRNHEKVAVVVPSDDEILNERFRTRNCIDCGRDESGHEVERDRYGDVVVRCVWHGYYVEGTP